MAVYILAYFSMDLASTTSIFRWRSTKILWIKKYFGVSFWGTICREATIFQSRHPKVIFFNYVRCSSHSMCRLSACFSTASLNDGAKMIIRLFASSFQSQKLVISFGHLNTKHNLTVTCIDINMIITAKADKQINTIILFCRLCRHIFAFWGSRLVTSLTRDVTKVYF